MTVAPASREEIALLVKRAELTLTEEQFDGLVDSYAHVERMVARIHRARAYADEPAHVFVPTKFQAKGN